MIVHVLVEKAGQQIGSATAELVDRALYDRFCLLRDRGQQVVINQLSLDCYQIRVETLAGQLIRQVEVSASGAQDALFFFVLDDDESHPTLLN